MHGTHPRILLVDDDRNLLKLLSIRLRSAGYEVDTATSGEQALARLPVFQPQLVITDLRMDGMDGMALFDSLVESRPSLPVIILTAHGTIPDAVEATRRGVSGYLTKPFDSKELVAYIEKLLKLSGDAVQETVGAADGEWRRDIIATSLAMEEVLEQARRIASTDTSLLLQGPSGTGKELLAKAVHRASSRARGPFIPVNCSAIPEPLFESELFGHNKGSFTGATHSHPGLFQAADGGTLFLDEVGDMPATFQAKLLRALQEREVRPVGSTRTVTVDVRIISATHDDLEHAVEEGSFREDLYYRLNVVMLEIPPLAKRREDIPLLATHFLTRLRERTHSRVSGFAPEAMEVLLAAPWPGNVRQLLNVVEQCTVLSTTSLIRASLVRKALRDKPGEFTSFAEARRRFELEYLVGLLQITEGNITQAARLADRNRSEFYKLLNRHHLEPELFRASSAPHNGS